MPKHNKSYVGENGGGCEFPPPANKHRKTNPITTNNNLGTSSSQQMVRVIVHLDYHPFGSTVLTNFYRTYSKYKLESTIIINDNAKLSYDIMSHTNSCPSIPPQLLYRGTRDGFKAIDFHSRCDNQGPTLTIIKSAEHNQIFGGFTTQSWNSPLSDSSDDRIMDSSAFIFKIETNSNNTTNNRKVNHHHQLFRKFNIKRGMEGSAIYHTSFLPIFGGGHDIFISSDCNLYPFSYADFGWSYKLPTTRTTTVFNRLFYGQIPTRSYLAGSYYFKVSEIEVFKIVTIHNNYN